MAVTVDHESLEAEQLGLRTVGQVLSHVQRENRLVVNLLIDGEQPDLSHMPKVRQSPLNGHTLYIETVEPRQMALDVLHEVEDQLDEAGRLRSEAVELLQRNQTQKAMERLSGCFSTWHNAQESVLKTTQLLRIDVAKVNVLDRPLADLLAEFTAQLREIRTALESRDFVALCDILAYEMIETTGQWRAVLSSMRDVVRSR